jgi:hypothetical protein
MIFDESWMTFDESWMIFDESWMTFDESWMIFDESWMTFDVSWMTFDVSLMTFDVSWMTFYVSWMTFDESCVTFDESCKPFLNKKPTHQSTPKKSAAKKKNININPQTNNNKTEKCSNIFIIFSIVPKNIPQKNVQSKRFSYFYACLLC